MEMRKIKIETINQNVFTQIGSDWFLLTSGTEEKFNTMTASWGSMGVLWNYNICTVFVRPTRYTREFIEKNSIFSLSFFPKEFKNILSYCGANSGRDTDKISQTGLTPLSLPGGGIGFKQSSLCLVCKKIYSQDLDPQNFIEPAIISHYPQKDYHRMYIGEIKAIFE